MHQLLDLRLLLFGVGDKRSPRTLGWATEAGRVMGTASYMSPEQVLGQRAEAASDIFTLGCVLYETVAGVRPFAGDMTWPLWI